MRTSLALIWTSYTVLATYKITPEMRIPPLIRTLLAVSRCPEGGGGGFPLYIVFIVQLTCTGVHLFIVILLTSAEDCSIF